jgi:molecular chaperone GrpE
MNMKRNEKGFPAEADAEDEEIEILEIVGLDEDGEEIVFEEEEPAPVVIAESDYRDHAIRLQAEFENLKKRTDKEQKESRRFAAIGVVKRLLPVIDNFERALGSTPTGSDDDNFRQGFELIYKQLLDELRQEGLSPIGALGEPFDPNLHEAVETCRDPEHAPNSVVKELLKGYKFMDRLLRPAMVQVNLETVHDDEEAPTGQTE